jgi:hypothetical protein
MPAATVQKPARWREAISTTALHSLRLFDCNAMLIGADLLARVKELGDVPKADLVRGAGYASNGKDGRERLNFTAFYEAMLEAKGIHLGDSTTKKGRKLNHRLTVQANGAITVSKGYTAQMDLKPGDSLEIKLGRKQLRLVALDAPAEEEGGTEAGQGGSSTVGAEAMAPASAQPSGVYGGAAAAA